MSACALTACGKKGAPLPPLVRLPAAPADLVASRRGATVDLQFTVPVANTDNTRPANVERVDVYGITGPATLTDDEFVKHGTKVATVRVKAPRNPDQAVEPDDPDATIEPPEGTGADQGAVARVAEQLTADAMTPYRPAEDPSARGKDVRSDAPGPLLGPAFGALSRNYAAVAVSTRGKKGPMSRRVAAPLVPPPPAPDKPTITYTEKAVTVAWKPIVVSGMVQAPAQGGTLPSTPIGVPQLKISYNVYDAAPDEPSTANRVTKEPVAETRFEDPRIAWGARRCYTVRAIATVNSLPVESDAAAPECTTLVDTFPPSAPKNLQTVPAEGVINLIWDANTEPDTAGYVVLRGAQPDALQPITAEPIPDPRFTDGVPPGVRYFYAVKAVDKAGNVSAMSEGVSEAAR